jgi:adenosine deaminase
MSINNAKGFLVDKLPKVELHVHLDCSLSYTAVSQLDPSISQQEFASEFVAPAQCSSLADFLRRAPRGFQLMQTREALQLVTQDIFQQFLADNVIYAEIRFAPMLHLERGLRPDEVVAAIDRATEDCIRNTGIEARLILCTLRHFSSEQSLLTAKLAASFAGSRVVGLDIAGDEAGYSHEPHTAAFRFAADAGINRTAHAGEALGPASMWETLRAFRPQRIGHGVRSIEDPTLIEYLRDRQIHLEVCPSSNVQTRAVAKYGEHPIDALFKAGVSLGINTDARTITNINLEQEYAKLREHFAWNDQQFLACNKAALKASFLDVPTRDHLFSCLSQAQEPSESGT